MKKIIILSFIFLIVISFGFAEISTGLYEFESQIDSSTDINCIGQADYIPATDLFLLTIINSSYALGGYFPRSGTDNWTTYYIGGNELDVGTSNHNSTHKFLKNGNSNVIITAPLTNLYNWSQVMYINHFSNPSFLLWLNYNPTYPFFHGTYQLGFFEDGRIYRAGTGGNVQIGTLPSTQAVGMTTCNYELTNTVYFFGGVSDVGSIVNTASKFEYPSETITDLGAILPVPSSGNYYGGGCVVDELNERIIYFQRSNSVYYFYPENESFSNATDIYVPSDLIGEYSCLGMDSENDLYAFGTIDNTVFKWDYVAQTIPNIVITTPENGTRSNLQPNIIYVANHSINNSLVCDLYVNSILNQTNNSVLNNTNTTISISLVNGVYDYYINCSDGDNFGLSDTYTYDFDDKEPFIQSLTPEFNNNTVFTNYSMDIIGNVTDDKIWKVNRTIFFPNGSIFYNNYSGELPNVSVYSWSETFSTTFIPNGFYRLNIQSTDPHTKKYFQEAKNVVADNENKRLSFDMDYDNVTVELIGGNVMGLFNSISSTKLEDRYTFDVDFINELPPNRIMLFQVTAENGIKYLDWSEYHAHLIIADEYWLDFDGVEGDYVVTKITDNIYTIEITTKNAQKTFNFKSLGGLNDNEENITFQINNCVPDWVCIDYDTCNTTDQARCVMVQDNNYCGLGFGTLGETFDDYEPLSCNYCSHNIIQLNITECVGGNQTAFYEDLNFTTCCDVTQIGADCYNGIVQNVSIYQVEASCSIFDYDENDISPALINIIAGAILFIGSIIVLIVFFTLVLIGSNKIKNGSKN